MLFGWILTTIAFAADADTFSAPVSYQYLDAVEVSAPVSYQYLDESLTSALVSYQYFDRPGDENLTFQSSPSVSYYFHGGPAITRQPASQIAKVGTSIALSIEAQGSPPLSYQWRFDGNPLAGASSANLPLNSVQLANAGDYSVVVSNAYGTTNSAIARLNVYLAPATPQPLPPASTPATQSIPPALTASPRKPNSKQMIVFTGGGKLDPNKMTSVLTHGWNSSASDWPTSMKKVLSAKGYDATANIVAWDWHENANPKSPSTAAARTPSEGQALGVELLNVLGTGYDKPLHFMGHSLGTIVNCNAADYVHGDAAKSPGKLNPKNTHLTLFDEAELVSAIDAYHFALGSNLNGETASFFIDNPWLRVIPRQSAWIDNYISEVGLLHREAANVLLWRRTALPILSDLGDQGLHGYSYAWYSSSVADPLGSLMGHRWSFERDSVGSAPLRGSAFLQSLDLNESELAVTAVSEAVAAGLAGGYGAGVNRIVAYPTLKAYQGLSTIGNAVFGAYLDGIQYAGDFAANMAEMFTPLNGQPVFVGTANSTPAYFVPPPASSAFQAGWDLQFTLQKAVVSPVGLQGLKSSVPANAGSGTNGSIYAWLPVAVPQEAVGMSFQFRLDGAGPIEYFTMGISNNLYFTMEAKFVEDGVWTTSGVIEVSEYARKQTRLFFSLNGDGSPSGRLSVRGIQFYSPPTPSLSIDVQGTNAVLSWPVSAVGWQLETTDTLATSNRWTVLTNVPTVLNYQQTITNSASDRVMFYRLRR